MSQGMQHRAAPVTVTTTAAAAASPSPGPTAGFASNEFPSSASCSVVPCPQQQQQQHIPNLATIDTTLAPPPSSSSTSQVAPVSLPVSVVPSLAGSSRVTGVTLCPSAGAAAAAVTATNTSWTSSSSSSSPFLSSSSSSSTSLSSASAPLVVASSASSSSSANPSMVSLAAPAPNGASSSPSPGHRGSGGGGGHGGSGHGGGHHSATLAGNSQRLQRNTAEKQRRDKLTSSIAELATLVPMAGMSSKRLDKVSILRLSAAHIRIHQTPLVSRSYYSTTDQSSQGQSKSGPIRRKKRWRPSYVNPGHLRELMDVLEGFMLITNMHGKIIYVSPTVERFLGHQHIEMIGHSIFSFMHAADVETVHAKLQSLFSAKEQYRVVGDQLICDDVSFFCRIREKSQPRSEVITYQVIYAVGRITGPAQSEATAGSPLGSTGTMTTTTSPFSNNSHFLLKAFVRILNASPYKELSLVDANRDEYVTRHKLDGTIIYADHRIGTVTGHLPNEVVGVSAHKYMEPSDVVIALFAQKQMFASHSGKGVVVYRLRTRTDGFIYLRTSGYLHYDQSTMQVDHFVCVNTLMSPEEGERERQELCHRFSPHISSLTVEHLNEFFSTVHAHALRRIQRTKEASEINSTRHVPGGQALNPLALENLVEPNLYLGSNCLVKLKTKSDSEALEEVAVPRILYPSEKSSPYSGCSAAGEERSPSVCSATEGGVSVSGQTLNAEATSPLTRSDIGSPECANPPLTPSTSPMVIEPGTATSVAELSQLTQGHFASGANLVHMKTSLRHYDKQSEQEEQMLQQQQQQQQQQQRPQQLATPPSGDSLWNACELSNLGETSQSSMSVDVATTAGAAAAAAAAIGAHHRSSSSTSTGGYGGTLTSPSSLSSSSSMSDDVGAGGGSGDGSVLINNHH